MHAYRVGPLSLLMDPFCTCFRVDACLYARLHTFVPPPRHCLSGSLSPSHCVSHPPRASLALIFAAAAKPPKLQSKHKPCRGPGPRRC